MNYVTFLSEDEMQFMLIIFGGIIGSIVGLLTGNIWWAFIAGFGATIIIIYTIGD